MEEDDMGFGAAQGLSMPDAAFRADPKAPFSTSAFAFVIDGVHTDFVLTSYSNVLFFTITQLGKLGTIMMARRDLTMEGEPSYSVTSLLGKKDSETEIYARRLIEITSSKSSKPLILALGLDKSQQTNPKVFRAICRIVEEHTK